jgi:hypothetical protein
MTDEGMTQIVDARFGVAAAGTPVELRSQQLESILHSSRGRAVAVIEDEESLRSLGEGIPIASLRITA